MNKHYAAILLLALSACSRTPEFKAPDGDMGTCNGWVYRYDQAQLTLVKLNLGERLQQKDTSPIQLDVEKDNIKGEMLVFKGASPNLACEANTNNLPVKSRWKLLSGHITLQTGQCDDAQQCQTSAVLEDSLFGFEHEGQLIKLTLTQLIIDNIRL